MISQIQYSLEAFLICVNLCNQWELFVVCNQWELFVICNQWELLSYAICGRNSLFRVSVYLAVYLIIYIVGVEIDEYT